MDIPIHAYYHPNILLVLKLIVVDGLQSVADVKEYLSFSTSCNLVVSISDILPALTASSFNALETATRWNALQWLPNRIPDDLLQLMPRDTSSDSKYPVYTP